MINQTFQKEIFKKFVKAAQCVNNIRFDTSLLQFLCLFYMNPVLLQ